MFLQWQLRRTDIGGGILPPAVRYIRIYECGITILLQTSSFISPQWTQLPAGSKWEMHTHRSVEKLYISATSKRIEFPGDASQPPFMALYGGAARCLIHILLYFV